MKKKKIVILGGGTAGWMTASLMVKKWKDQDIEITLVESPEIGIIGVGEGSTPLLKTFFKYLDIDENEWMPQCNATYKTGITFENWSTKPEFESYFHPFQTVLDGRSTEALEYNSLMRRKGINIESHPDNFFLTKKLADKKLAPIPHDNFPFEVTYGYHFDSVLLGAFLKKKMLTSGVKHIEATVKDAIQDKNGNIVSLKTNCEKTVDADFFVDCTGFVGYLIQKKIGVPFVSFSDNLFNDSAIAMPSEKESNISSSTISTALSNGWAWKIPLQNRVGNGYVYSSNYCSADDAEIELRKHIGMLDSDQEARHIKMKVGRLKDNWSKNCVAIGLSQGFIEPLEATALHFIQNSIQEFMVAYERGGFTNQNKETYNNTIRKSFEKIRDYIVLHYNTNSRSDTDYWKDNHSNPNISDSLNRVIECWMSGGNLRDEIKQQGIDKYYQSISWHSLFAGMGIFPPVEQLVKGKKSIYKHDMTELNEFLTRCSLNFDTQNKFLSNQNKITMIE